VGGLLRYFVSSGRSIRSFTGHSSSVWAVAFSPDGKLALSGSWDGSTRLWNVQTGEEIVQMWGFKDGEWATVTAQGYYVASAGGEKYINVRIGNKVSGVEPYRNRPDLVKVALQTGERDTTPPRIVLHPKKRLIRDELVIDTHTLRGQAIDKSGVASVTVNGQAASLDKHGYFTFELQLGENSVKIAATDLFDNTAHKKFTLNFQPKAVEASGKYHALVIGINRYPYLNKPRFDINLDTAVNDARSVANILQKNYGFTVKTLINQQASRRGILRAYRQLLNKATKDDHLLIYYAGHGYRDTKMDKAYWLPADAEHYEDTWIVADRITGYMKRSDAKNILIVADSCYAGGIAKTRNYMPWWQTDKSTRQHFLKKMKQESSRILISSGGDHPVLDSGGDGHSIFAQAFIDGLRQSNGAFTAEELLLYVKQRVAGTSAQVPEIYFIRNSGHRGGDFVFEGR